MIRRSTPWEAERVDPQRSIQRAAPSGAGPLAIVTGASSGIGAAIAAGLARRGYRAILIARRRGALEALGRRCYESGCWVAQPLDLDRWERIGPEVRPLLAEHGPPEVLINSAGVGLYKPFLEHGPRDFERLMRTNYLSAVEMIRAVLPLMLARKCGTIINIASMSSKIGPWGHGAYAASKAALVSLTQTLAAEHEGSGVHFCYVNPGIIRTEYFDCEDTRGLWPVVQRYALEVGPTAQRILGLIDHPRLELCIPSHYRFLDWLKALSINLAHRLVSRTSRPVVLSPSGGVEPATQSVHAHSNP